MSYRRFEPPLVKPLYITLHRAAEILGVPYHRMQSLSFRLGRVYFGPGGGAPRVLLSKVEELKAYADAQAQPPEAPEPSIANRGWHRRGT